jgi:hypothetical protein
MEAEQSIDQRGFTSAIGPEQAYGLALQLSREAIQNGPATQSYFQAVKINDAHVTLLRFERRCCSLN